MIASVRLRPGMFHPAVRYPHIHTDVVLFIGLLIQAIGPSRGHSTINPRRMPHIHKRYLFFFKKSSFDFIIPQAYNSVSSEV